MGAESANENDKGSPKPEEEEEEFNVEEALEESFPASDPPNWTLGREKETEQ